MKKLLLLLVLVSFVGLAQTAPPANLAASLTGTTYKQVSLTWQYDSTATFVKYYIYKKTGTLADTTKSFIKVASTTRRYFVDGQVQVGKTYSYYVTAVKNMVASGPSNKVEIGIPVPPPPAYGKISGTILEDGTSLPLGRANVQIFAATPNSTTTFVSVMTDSNGKFTAKVKIGNYKIWTGKQGYIAEYYNNVATKDLATVVPVIEGDSLVYSISLAKIVPPVLFTVKGQVVNESGAPLKAEITAYSTKFRGPQVCSQYRAFTDSLGFYTLKIKENDTVVVYTMPKDRTLKTQYYNNKETFATADKVVVSANVENINFILHPKPVFANGIGGKVLDSAGTSVPYNGMVYIYRKSTGFLSFKKGIRTDTVTGAYVFTNLEPGQYIALAKAPGYKPTYFQYDGTPTLNWREADSIVVTETGVVAINFNLKLIPAPMGSAVVYGFVKDEMGVSDGSLNYIVDANGNFVDYAVSDVDGSYYIESLGYGSFKMISSLVNHNDKESSVLFEETGTLVANIDVNLTPSGVTSVNDNTVITGYALNQNYPNPFNPTTVISYSVPQSSLVSLKVYNVLGKEVATLVSEMQSAGQHFVTFNAKDLASGVYLYKIQAGDFTAVKKFTLIK